MPMGILETQAFISLKLVKVNPYTLIESCLLLQEGVRHFEILNHTIRTDNVNKHITNPGCSRPISLSRTSQSPNSLLLLLFGFETSDQWRRNFEKGKERLIGVQSANTNALVLFLQIGRRQGDSDSERDKNNIRALRFYETGDNKYIGVHGGDLPDVCTIVKIYKKHYTYVELVELPSNNDLKRVYNCKKDVSYHYYRVIMI